MDLLSVREGIAFNLSSIDGLKKAYSYWPDDGVPPLAVVSFPDSWSFQTSMSRSASQIEPIVVYLVVGRGTDRQAQQDLSQFVATDGAMSIKAAIESDRTLGGACSDCQVQRVYGFGGYSLAGSEMLGCKFDVAVIG